MIIEFALSTTMSTFTLTGGASPTANYVESLRRESRAHIEQSHTFGSAVEQARQQLSQIATECCAPNWDGHGARAVSHDAHLQAYRFLESLPLGAEIPSPGVDPDGELTFEWHHGPHHTLSVSVTEEGDLHYAALIGSNKTFGTEAFLGDLPKTIVELISRLSATSRS